jgi:hypothetical protein
MVKVSLCMLSLGSSLDKQSGSLSIFDVLEEIRVDKMPITIYNLSLSVGLKKLENKRFDGKLFVHVLSPEGESHTVGSSEISMGENTMTKRSVVKFTNFPISKFGKTRFVISVLNSSNEKISEGISDIEVFLSK